MLPTKPPTIGPTPGIGSSTLPSVASIAVPADPPNIPLPFSPNSVRHCVPSIFSVPYRYSVLLISLDDSWLCSSCLHGETIVCQDCGERIWADANAGDGNTPLYRRCYDRNYTSCEDCGRVLYHNDAYYDDDDDYEARFYHCHCRHEDQRTIHDYYYKSEPEFYGEGNRWFGVELEIEDAGEINSNAAKIENVANSGEERITANMMAL